MNKLIAKHLNNLQRVYTERDSSTLSGHKQSSAVEVVARTTNTKGSTTVTNLLFKNNKHYRVTIEEVA